MKASVNETLRLFDRLDVKAQTEYLEHLRGLFKEQETNEKKAPTSAATEHEGSYRGLFIHTRQA